MWLAYHLETSHTAEEGDRDFDVRLLGFPFYDLWDSEAVFAWWPGPRELGPGWVVVW